MDASATTSLQIPDWTQPGPSSSRAPRPASAAVTPNSMSQSPSKKRASHSVATSHTQQQEEVSSYRDVYSHPAAIAFATAHPRRTIPKFGPYLLLQTVGEGEFGKVKLGLHGQWGEEVAVKLIRRGSVDNSVRMSKVEREIEVLRTIKHPNIVRLYDVIETDKYIGIILEYASGGELFDHILAHRYLKEKDACKLFAQLISGVYYIHAKKIVHRDLKLENLLLDRNRNVIITDFGFANRFEHRADDLMQTSCGSPCYAAPELVISEGLYVGSAVDIWSCGVILYAMLAGYLPFDDDPANPDGDNINLLYKYIVNTPLTFPDYVSPDARDLLSMMLVPDPKLRSGLPDIMDHRWLAPYRHLFDRSVSELERMALDQQNQKRQAYQRQMRSHAAEQRDAKQSRSTHRSDMPSQRQRQQQDLLYDSSVQDLSASPTGRRAVASAVVIRSSAPAEEDDPFVAQSSVLASQDEVEAQGTAREESRSKRSKSKESSRSKRSHKEKSSGNATKSPEKDGSRRKKGPYRHTIQLEYPDESPQLQNQGQPSPQVSPSADVDMVHISDAIMPAQSLPSPLSDLPATDAPVLVDSSSMPSPAHEQPPTDAVASVTPSQHLPRSATEPGMGHAESSSTPLATAPIPVSTQAHTLYTEPVGELMNPKTDTGSTGSSGSRHRRGISITKLFGNGTPEGEDTPKKSPSSFLGKKASAQMDEKLPTPSPDSASKTGSIRDSVSKPASIKDSNKSKSRRNTLSLMVDPLRTIKDRKNRSVTVDAISSKTKAKEDELPQKKKVEAAVPTSALPLPPAAVNGSVPIRPLFKDEHHPEASGVSSLSAKSVMNWFRLRSLSKRGDAMPPPVTPATFEIINKPTRVPSMDTYVGGPGASSSSSVGQPPVQVIVTTPGNQAAQVPSTTPRSAHLWSRSPSESSAPRNGLANVMRNITGVGASSAPSATLSPRRGKFDNSSLRVHHGAYDQAMITTGVPPEVFAHVTKVLLGMGLEVQKETEFKYRCIRPKKRKAGRDALGRQPSDGGGYAAFTMIGSAASNGVDKRGLPIPSHTSFTSGGMLRGLLMRRQSSQVSTHAPAPVTPGPSQSFETEPESMLSDSSINPTLTEPLPSGTAVDPLYGDRTIDQGDEVRFSVELTRIDRLDDTLILDIRRLKGNLRSYKFLYDTLRERCNFTR